MMSKFSNVIRFPEKAITDLRNIPTKKLIKLFWDWDGYECDKYGTESCRGYSIVAIRDEVNKRGYGEKVAV